MGVKRIVKGLAVGAALAGIASLVVSLKEERNKKAAKEMAKVAKKISGRVADHAKKLGKLSKAAYGNIVHNTVGEYRDAKTLSKSDLTELKKDMLDSWSEVRNILKDRSRGPARKSRAKKGPAKK